MFKIVHGDWGKLIFEGAQDIHWEFGQFGDSLSKKLSTGENTEL